MSGTFASMKDLQSPSTVFLIGPVEQVLDNLLRPSLGQLDSSDIVGDNQSRDQEHGSTILSRPEPFLVLESFEELESVASSFECRLCFWQIWGILWFVIHNVCEETEPSVIYGTKQA
jgi:hypothetical protein